MLRKLMFMERTEMLRKLLAGLITEMIHKKNGLHMIIMYLVRNDYIL